MQTRGYHFIVCCGDETLHRNRADIVPCLREEPRRKEAEILIEL